MSVNNLQIVLVTPKSDHSWESLGLGYIAAYSYLFGFQPNQYSFFHGQFDSDETIVAGCEHADIIAFSLTTFQVSSALVLIHKIRKINRIARIVWGGYAVNGLTEKQLLDMYGSSVNYFIQGPGEESWVAFLQNSNPPRIMRKQLMNYLDSVPFPDRDLIRVDRHFEKLATIGEGRKTSMEMQRGGCPFNCVFCAARSYSRKRGLSRSAQNIVSEMEMLRDRYGMDQNSMVLMCDAEVFLTQEMAIMAQLKIERGITFGYGMNVVASTILDTESRNVLEKMVQSGCREIWMGVECGPSLLHLTGKPNTANQLREAFRITNEMGLARKAYFILGFTPEETEETIKERIAFIEELDPDEVGFSLYIPVPGSLGYRHEEHRHIDYSVSCEYHNSFTHTDTLSNEDLKYWQKYLVEYFNDKIGYRQKHTDSKS